MLLSRHMHVDSESVTQCKSCISFLLFRKGRIFIGARQKGFRRILSAYCTNSKQSCFVRTWNSARDIFSSRNPGYLRCACKAGFFLGQNGPWWDAYKSHSELTLTFLFSTMFIVAWDILPPVAFVGPLTTQWDIVLRHSLKIKLTDINGCTFS